MAVPTDSPGMPVEELAMTVLERLATSDPRPQGKYTLRDGSILTWVHEWDRNDGATRSQSEAARARPSLVDALAEAWEWLRTGGREILDFLEPLEMMRAQRRLGVELHPRLAT